MQEREGNLSEGNVIYVIQGGSAPEERPMRHLFETLATKTDAPIYLLSARERSGQEIINKFGVHDLPAVLIIKDGQVLSHHWSGHHIPPVSQIAHFAR